MDKDTEKSDNLMLPGRYVLYSFRACTLNIEFSIRGICNRELVLRNKNFIARLGHVTSSPIQ